MRVLGPQPRSTRFPVSPDRESFFIAAARKPTARACAEISLTLTRPDCEAGSCWPPAQSPHLKPHLPSLHKHYLASYKGGDKMLS